MLVLKLLGFYKKLHKVNYESLVESVGKFALIGYAKFHAYVDIHWHVSMSGCLVSENCQLLANLNR